MTVLRDIFRRRLRSVLTMCGIAVGVFTLAVLGAMAEKANVTLETSAEYYADKVTVVEQKAGAFGYNTSGSRPLSYDKIEELKRHPGVLDVAPQVAMGLEEKALPVGVPSLVVGGFVGTERYPERWKAAEGRMLEESERGVAVVGPDLVRQLNAEVGGRVVVRGLEFDVVGISERSNTMIDQAVIIPLADAQAIYAKALPPAFAKSVVATRVATQATVYVDKGRDANGTASSLNRDVEGVHATGPTQLKQQLGQRVALFTAILFVAASIAMIVGSLSVVNTMMMSLAERGREVGLKRALGASRMRVGLDVLAESAVIGGLGGLGGVLIAAVAVAALNLASRAGNGTTMFLMTSRLALGVWAFGVVVGASAGVFPAWRTSRMDPSTALAPR